ncbi:hypothetical protein FE257_004185 [Aspergillus nanangensis]|uniref:Arrestin-like N-terminal domain-containing protein n=1 Tax=Aspergillus nanangensis TaxID=2582783 RepID=A0AAD4CRG4_ASPNN|nr:hypothetical protein FE257_004185 [Aspergillus nanangensis]
MKRPWITSRRLGALRITIELDKYKENYTTWDQIEGTVAVTADTKTAFGDVDITLEGLSRVAQLQPITTSSRGLKPSHTFLKLHQPMDSTKYPTSRTLVPGELYTFPFTFVIPAELPLGSCLHGASDPSIQQTHSQLPPTVCLETLSQELCRISYLIRVAITPQGTGKKREVLATSTRSLHVVPTTWGGQDYSNRPQDHPRLRCLADEELKSDWKAVALGRFAVIGHSPASFLCPSTKIQHNSVTFQLRFDPVGDIHPPRLRTLHSSLMASTTLTTSPKTYLLSPTNMPTNTPGCGEHVTAISFPSVDISSTRWIKHVSTSTRGLEAAEVYYTASMTVPIHLPKNGGLLPTFHSCLVSRTYLLKLRLSYRMHNTPAAVSRAIKLETPIIFINGSITPPQYRMDPQNLSQPPPPYSAPESPGIAQGIFSQDVFSVGQDQQGISLRYSNAVEKTLPSV